MSAAGDTEATNRLAPSLAGAGGRSAAHKDSTAGAGATAFISIPNVEGRTWITVLPTLADVHIAFGTSSMGAPTQTDRIFLIGQEYDYELPPQANGFRMIRDTPAAVDCALYWHVSS